MTLLSSRRVELDDEEVQLSYFVNHKSHKPSRIGHAKLVEISQAGLCMEISPYDSDLFLGSQGKLFIMSKDLEMQIFCRSHPMNVSVGGSISWFRQKKELGEIEDRENIYIGVIFAFSHVEQRNEIWNLVRRLKNDMARCGECNAMISADAFICYNCGSKPTQKRNIFRKMIDGFLISGND